MPRPTDGVNRDTTVEEAERIYRQVQDKLTAARKRGVEEAKQDNRRGHYAHDLFAALRAADRQMDREAAGAFIEDVCGGNLFKALGLIIEWHLASDEPLRSSETRPQQAKRALESELRDLERNVRWAEERRREDDLG